MSVLPDLPQLRMHLDQLESRLAESGQLGVLSIVVMQRDRGDVEDGWADYEKTLAELSLYLRSRIRQTDMLVEPAIAGNTFLVILDSPREQRALDLMDLGRVRRRLERRLNLRMYRSLPHSAIKRFGVYVGSSLLRHDPNVRADRVIHRAVEAAFADAVGQRGAEGSRNASQLRRILHGRNLFTVYQPVVNLQDRKIVGLEALTRVAEAQFTSPDLLFKAAGENGALWNLERLSRRRALEGLPAMDEGQLLFLNIEPSSIRDPQLGRPEFLSQLEGVGLSASQVVLEMTEHAPVQDFAELRDVLDRVRSHGYRLAMDDVGSGFAGLQAIAEIAPDYLKLDMSLVRDLHRHPLKYELVETIRRFTDRTGSELVAEGVETRDELHALIQAGVRCAQGYLFARPQTRPELTDWDSLLLEPTGV